MITDSLVTRAAELCRMVAPHEAAGRGVYIVPFSRIAKRYPLLSGGANVGAWTSSTLDVWLQPFLEDRGEWQGRGFATVLHDTNVDASDCCAVVLHELARWLLFTYSEAITTMPLQEIPAGCLYDANDIAALPANYPAADVIRPVDPTVSSWWQHEDHFIRTAIHLRLRAAMRGVPVSLRNRVIGGPSYRLSDGVDYAYALAGEPWEREGDSFASILASEPPAAFTGLWERDTGG